MNSNDGMVIKFKDKYGDTRVIRGTRRGLQLQRREYTVSLYLMPVIGRIVGQKIRDERQKAGLSGAELCIKAGLAFGRHPKHRMYEIEHNTRPHGVKLGTLYAIAAALNIEIGALLPTRQELYDVVGINQSEVTPFTRFPAPTRTSVQNRPLKRTGQLVSNGL